VVGRSSTAVEACRQIGISEQTLYRWRKEYGGLKVDQARRMKDLERENARLKKLVADFALDKAIQQGSGAWARRTSGANIACSTSSASSAGNAWRWRRCDGSGRTT
jgi:transposase-like protein